MRYQTSNKKYLLSAIIILLSTYTLFAQETVRYELTITDTIVNFTGKAKRAIAVNGQIPMPALTFYEGDTAEITVHNHLKESTSLHWHGLYVPNKEDGVPFLTQIPIQPGETFVYRFPIIQSGTHWYHSHFGFQEQIGMYGSLTLIKRKSDPTFIEGVDDLRELPIILSEWTDKNPKNINRMLHYANDWSSIKKGSVQSYGEAIAAHHFTTKFRNEWKRMMAMDVSDVYYDKFLMNGSTNKKFDQFKPGEKVRLRISNGGASSYFWLKYSGGKITVVANDGNDVVPVEVDRLIIGVSETYDIVIQIPDTGMSYELLATPEDRTKSSSMFFGDGPVYLATRMPRLDYFEGMKMMNDMMTINGNMKDMGMDMSVQKMNMSNVMYPELNESTETVSKHQHEKSVKDDSSMGDMDMEMGAETSIVTLNYSMLKSFQNTTLPSDATVKELHFELTGNMRRYVWSMDNRILDEVDKIKIKKGENVRIILYNNSMMRHPMHLHGHDFRLLNGQGINAPLMNVLDILPMETDTIEFEANLKGDWFFHCHILYHMMAGMNRVFSYENQDSNPYLPNKKWAYKKLQNESNPIHFTVSNDFASNGNDGQMLLQNTRWSFGTEWRLGYNDKNGYETETHVGRYIGKNQFLMPFVGFDWRYRKFGIDEQERNLFGQTNTKDSRSLFSVGFNYTLPMLIVFQVEVFHDGSTRMQLLRNDIPISKRMRMAFMVNTDKEYMAGLKYILNKNIAISTHYDSDMGFGAGMTLTY